MKKAMTTCVALCALLAACGAGNGSSASRSRFDQDRAFKDLGQQVLFGPRPSGSAANRRTASFIARRLRAAGARGVRIQKPWLNVVGYLPGRKRGAVVVGAHYDTVDVPGFVGANDGASGVAVALELARTLPRPLPGPAVHFALFDKEEARPGMPFLVDGIRGSRQYVSYAKRSRSRRQGSPALRSIAAMILFDMVGDCSLQIPREAGSDEDLYSIFKGKPFSGQGGGVSDDHVPFLQARIPAVDLIDFTYGANTTPGPFWHTTEDNIRHVCAGSLGQVGRAALSAIPRIR